MATSYYKSSMFVLLAITLFLCSYANANDHVPHTRIGDRKLLGGWNSLVNFFTTEGKNLGSATKGLKGTGTLGVTRPVANGVKAPATKVWKRVPESTAEDVVMLHDLVASSCSGLLGCDSQVVSCALFYCVYSPKTPENCQKQCGQPPAPNCLYYYGNKTYSCNP